MFLRCAVVLSFVVCACGPVGGDDAGTGGPALNDAGAPSDAGTADGGNDADAGVGVTDAGQPDDAGAPDAGAPDAGSDAGANDAGQSDAGTTADGGPGFDGGVCDPYQAPYVPPQPSDGGCGTDAELCFAAQQSNCGTISTPDRCGVIRVASCGTCPAQTTCGGDTAAPAAMNHCGGTSCAHENDATFCQRLGRNCGSVTALDNCGVTKTADCGTCLDGSCGGAGTPNVCTRFCPETDAQICARHGFSFGRLRVPDCCGYRRDAYCGLGTEMQRSQFVLPPIPAGPGMRCWGGKRPFQEGATNWSVDPDVILDVNVRVTLNSRPAGTEACLSGEAAAANLYTGCYFTCTPSGSTLNCTTQFFPGSSLTIAPPTASVVLNSTRGGFANDNGVFFSNCTGTGPYP